MPVAIPPIAISVEQTVRSMLGLPDGLVYPTAYNSAQSYRLSNQRSANRGGADGAASLASDGTYLYLLRPSGLQKIGAGGSTEAGRLYAEVVLEGVGPGGWVGVVGQQLVVRAGLARPADLTLLDPATLEVTATVTAPGTGPCLPAVVDGQFYLAELALQQQSQSQLRRQDRPVASEPASRAAVKKTCPDGHALNAYTAPPGGHCDGCMTKISSPTAVMDCRQCKYWLCSDCSKGVDSKKVGALMAIQARAAGVSDALDMGDSDSDGGEVLDQVHRLLEDFGSDEPAPEDEPAAEGASRASKVAGHREVLHFKPVALGGAGIKHSAGDRLDSAGLPDSPELFIPVESTAMVSFAGGAVLANTVFPVHLRARKSEKEKKGTWSETPNRDVISLLPPFASISVPPSPPSTDTHVWITDHTGRTDEVPAHHIKVVVKLAEFECALTRSGRVIYRNGTQKLGGEGRHVLDGPLTTCVSWVFLHEIDALTRETACSQAGKLTRRSGIGCSSTDRNDSQASLAIR